MAPDLGIIPRLTVVQPEKPTSGSQQAGDTMGEPRIAEMASGALSFHAADDITHCVAAAGEGLDRHSGPAVGAAPPPLPLPLPVASVHPYPIEFTRHLCGLTIFRKRLTTGDFGLFWGGA